MVRAQLSLAVPVTEINTHNLVIDFGKHKGSLWTRVPVSYLHWLINAAPLNGSAARAIARAELKRRGTTLPLIEVSGHAIDRASLSCRKIWHQTARDENEGLHAWLCRVAMEALGTQPPERAQGAAGAEIIYLGMKLIFVFGESYPALKTVHPV